MMLKEVPVPPEADGRRAADWIRLQFPDLPESALRRLFEARDIKADGRRISRDTVLSAGQMLRLYLPDSAADRADPAPSLNVVYEDDNMLLVNKPAGISVEPDARGGVTLTDLCAAHAVGHSPGGFFPAACHRLDNKTSGLCLFAKTEEALLILQDAFRQRRTEKTYECLVRGMMKPPQAVCSAWLVKDPRRAVVRITDSPCPGAKPITTGYETIATGAVSRLRVRLYTGRTHQIRAHLAALGHPILGDDVYGDRDLNRREKARNLKLCAVSLRLNTGGRLPEIDDRLFEIQPPF